MKKRKLVRYMTGIPWTSIIELFVDLMVGLVPAAVVICLGVALWKFWLRVTGLK